MNSLHCRWLLTCLLLHSPIPIPKLEWGGGGGGGGGSFSAVSFSDHAFLERGLGTFKELTGPFNSVRDRFSHVKQIGYRT